MSCGNGTTGGGDSTEGNGGSRPFDGSATGWLVGQAVRYLNTADKEGELAYQRVVEILRQRGDLLETVTGLFRHLRAGDAPLRWNLLHVLGDAANAGAADFLVHMALARLPEPDPDSCESARDMELLVATMAINALGRVAKREPASGEAVLKVVAAKPALPLLIEAVKVASDIGLRDKAGELLPQEERWILEIRSARTEELFAEPEREDGRERGFTPPRRGDLNTAPQAGCCTKKEK